MDRSVKQSQIRWKVVLAIALLTTASLSARAQQGGSLADAARQARAQKQAGSATSQAQKIADQLSEDQNDKDAPGGFAAYRAAGYKLTVPGPYSVSGHENAGVVLSGPRVGAAVTMVLVGDPFIVHGNSEDALHDAAMQFAQAYAQSTKCVAADRQNAYQCSISGGNLLGHEISGSALFLRSAETVYPVLCGASTASRARDILNDPHASFGRKQEARRAQAQEEDSIREVAQKCVAVFASVRIDPNAPAPGSAPSPKQSLHTADAVEVTAALQPGSTVPAGFKVHRFNYCRSRNECWDASVLVPSAAVLVSSDCNQYVFEIKLKGLPFLLMTGSEGGDGCEGRRPDDPSLVRWQQLVAPENQRAPGTSSTVSDQQTSLEGKPAIVTEAMAFPWLWDAWPRRSTSPMVTISAQT